MPARFPRSARLLRQQEFKYVFADARAFRNPAFTLLARKNDQPTARLGLAISRKAARKAVQRNRLKRLVRESFRRWRQQLPAIDIVVLARPEAVNMRNSEIHKMLEQSWISMKKDKTLK